MCRVAIKSFQNDSLSLTLASKRGLKPSFEMSFISKSRKPRVLPVDECFFRDPALAGEKPDAIVNYSGAGSLDPALFYNKM